MPTSGKRPMAVSGMAKSARSVATRKRPCAVSPTPPPMTMPSQRATWGLGSWAIWWFMMYSCRKKSDVMWPGAPWPAPESASFPAS